MAAGDNCDARSKSSRGVTAVVRAAGGQKSIHIPPFRIYNIWYQEGPGTSSAFCCTAPTIVQSHEIERQNAQFLSGIYYWAHSTFILYPCNLLLSRIAIFSAELSHDLCAALDRRIFNSRVGANLFVPYILFAAKTLTGAKGRELVVWPLSWNPP